MLPASQVSDTVELDEILRAFDPKTRAAFQDWMQTQAQAISGHGQDLNDALGNLAPFAEDTADIVSILNKQEGAVSRLIANTGVVFGALSERDGQLRSLIENTNTVFATTASRDEQLKAAFRALPTFEKESELTFKRLDEFAAETDPLITQLRPAARELSPTLQELEKISPDLRNLLEQLQPLIDASVKGFPAAEKTLEDLRPLIAQLDPATAQLDARGRLHRLLQARADVVLRQHRRGDAGQGPRDQRPLPAHQQPAEPGEPRGLSEPAADQPAEPVPPAGWLRRARRKGLAVYEDRQCVASNLLPTVVNTPLTLVNNVVDAVPTAIPSAGRDDRGRGRPAAADRAAADPAGAADARAGLGADPGRAAAAGSRISRSAGRPGRASSRRRAASRGRSTSAASARSTRRSTRAPAGGNSWWVGQPHGRRGCSRWCSSSPCSGGGLAAWTALALGRDVDAGRLGLRLRPRDGRRPRALRRRRGLRARPRRPPAAGADGGPQPAARARGLPVRERAGGCVGAGRCRWAVRVRSLGTSPCGSSTGRARSSTRPSRSSRRSCRAAPASGRRRRTGPRRRRRSSRWPTGAAPPRRASWARRPSSSSTRSSRRSFWR